METAQPSAQPSPAVRLVVLADEARVRRAAIKEHRRRLREIAIEREALLGQTTQDRIRAVCEEHGIPYYVH